MSVLRWALVSKHHTLATLLKKFGIQSKLHPAHKNLVMFKYSQISSPMNEPIVQACRGCILDSDDNWNYVARPFDKFFN